MKKQIFVLFVLLCWMSWPMSGLSQDAEPQPEATASEEQEHDSSAPEEASEEKESSKGEASSKKDGEAEKLNINFAGSEDLLLLAGGNEELAGMLAEGRPYAKLDDIMAVEGMTAEIFAEIRDLAEIRKLNLNDATIAELLLLPGIDPPIARAIIEHRPYKTVKRLLIIRGISEKGLQEFQRQIEAKPAHRRTSDNDKGWNIKKHSAPRKIQRPLEKRSNKEDDDFFRTVPDDEETDGAK